MRKTIRRARSITLHDWGLDMRIGKAAAPGTPVGTTSWPTYEEVKHQLKHLPMVQSASKRRRSRRKRA